MDWTSIAIAGLGGLNIVQFVMQFFTFRSTMRKENAVAKQEEGNSVEKSQAIYDKLTERVDRELDKLYKRIDDQDMTIGQQAEEISMLHHTVEGYKEKCAHCTNNSIKKES